MQNNIQKRNNANTKLKGSEGIPLGIGYRRLESKTRMMVLLGRERSSTISSAIWIQYTNVTDRQRLTAKTALTHSVARQKLL